MRYPLTPYDRCSFCDDLSGGRECAFVAQNELAAAEIDLRQYEAGAMLVIPRAHRESILDITPEELEAVYRLAQQVGRAATRALGAVGMNVYQNNGIKAGQHEPHFHVHVVPRYEASDPDRLFRQRDYPAVPLHEQHGLAARIRSALQESPAA
jgi:histidine triad (HIT) family protein